MLQDRYETDKLFESILKLTNEIHPFNSSNLSSLNVFILVCVVRTDNSRNFPKMRKSGRRHWL